MTWWEELHSPRLSGDKLREAVTASAAMPEGMGWWALETRPRISWAPGPIVGIAILRPAPYDETVELGYHLARAVWGRGFATEAARAVIAHAFDSLELPELSAVVHVDNRRSHAVMGRLGFQETGPITHHELPHLRYALRRDGPGRPAHLAAERAGGPPSAART